MDERGRPRQRRRRTAPDVLDHLSADDHTGAFALHVESVADAPQLVDAVRRLTCRSPVAAPVAAATTSVHSPRSTPGRSRRGGPPGGTRPGADPGVGALTAKAGSPGCCSKTCTAADARRASYCGSPKRPASEPPTMTPSTMSKGRMNHRLRHQCDEPEATLRGRSTPPSAADSTAPQRRLAPWRPQPNCKPTDSRHASTRARRSSARGCCPWRGLPCPAGIREPTGRPTRW